MQPEASRDHELMGETMAERRLRRLGYFSQPYRRYIAGLTSCAPPVEDLADSYPALLFALATGYGSVRTRQAAFNAVMSGEPLKFAAAHLGLPLWLRRLPAEAFQQPLPELPQDQDFSITAANRVPEKTSEAVAWFERLIIAYRLAGRDFALWVLREPRWLPPHTSDEDLQWLLAWAWASANPAFSGNALLRLPWTPATGWKRARDEVAIWRKRIDLVGALAGPPRAPWLADASVNGYDIVGLHTAADYIAESLSMENCLDQYAAHLSYGRIRIFSVRRDGRPVADVEITVKPEEPARPCISQIRGPRNRRAPPSVWQAVNTWIDGQGPCFLDTTPTSVLATRAAFREFWAPYVAVAEAAGLPPRVLARILGRDGRPRSNHRPAPPVRPQGAGTTPLALLAARLQALSGAEARELPEIRARAEGRQSLDARAALAGVAVSRRRTRAAG